MSMRAGMAHLLYSNTEEQLMLLTASEIQQRRS